MGSDFHTYTPHTPQIHNFTLISHLHSPIYTYIPNTYTLPPILFIHYSFLGCPKIVVHFHKLVCNFLLIFQTYHSLYSSLKQNNKKECND